MSHMSLYETNRTSHTDVCMRRFVEMGGGIQGPRRLYNQSIDVRLEIGRLVFRDGRACA